MGKVHRHTRLRPALAVIMAVMVAWSCAMETEPDLDMEEEAQGWRWPNQQQPIERTISSRRPAIEIPPVRLGGKQQAKPIPEGFSVIPGQPNLPARLPAAPQKPAVAPQSRPAASNVPPPPAPQRAGAPLTAASPPAKAPTPAAPSADPVDSEAGGSSATNKSSVPLLIDAGKPGNPYVLLNKEFPPENSIRTQGQEEAVLEDLRTKDLGGLEPEEVWLADNDLFVVRGFNFKVPYSADHPGSPIHDYDAPAPRPPPPPEPGTVFYPTNQTEIVFNFPGAADFNSTDPGRLPAFPYPFLPPPPPHWHEEKEFSDKNPNHLFDNFNFGAGGPGGGGGNFPPNGPGFPPPSGLNGFPGGAPPGGPGGQPGAGPPSGPPPINFTIPEDDEEIPFTPLFAERPVEYYYPEHNTTSQPPGPFGPGVFVPPPETFFAPRDPNEILDVKIPQKLFRPPFNLPNYYRKQQPQQQKQPVSNPIWPQGQINQKLPAGLPGVHGLPGQQFAQSPALDASRPSATGGGHRTSPVRDFKPLAQQAGSNPVIEPVAQPVPVAPPKPSVVKTPVETFKEPLKIPSVVEQPAIPPTTHSSQGSVQPPVKYQVYKPVLLDNKFKEVPSLPDIIEPALAVPAPPHENHQFYVPHPYPYYQHPEAPVKPPHSLEGDTDVNFQYPPPPIDPDSELIDPLKLLAPWDPYTIRSQRPQPLSAIGSHSSWPYPRHLTDRENPSSSPSHGFPKNKGNFVSVYRQGGGSYSYNLNS